MIRETLLDNYKVSVQYIIDEKVVGTVLVEETLDVINIIDVFVEEDYRRKGIASKLLSYIFKKYLNTHEKIMLEVRVSNIFAINLYKKFNFKIIHTREKYYKDEDAYIMEVKL